MAEQLRRAVPGGIGTYTSGLLQGLTQHGSIRLELWASEARGVDALSGYVSSGARLRSVALPSRVVTQLWDRGLLRIADDVQWCHATSLLTPGTSRRNGSARPDRPRLSVFVHDIAWREHPTAYPRRGRRWHEAALRRTHARAELVFCPSAATADMLIADGFRASHVRVVDEGADHLPLHERAGEGSYLLAVATREPRKNLDRLVAAYAIARPLLPEPWPLRIVGPTGWGKGPTEAPGVEFVGRVDDGGLAREYAGARAFVYVPLTEGYGLPPLEAMRAGVPVLASPVPSVRDSALLVDPTDVNAIAGQLVRVATDDLLRVDLRKAGAARAAASTWRASAEQHVACWQTS